MLPRENGSNLMAIFARLVLMLISIASSAAFGGILVLSYFDAFEPDVSSSKAHFAATLAFPALAYYGVRIGRTLGDLVAGPLPTK
jgi:hypothetical protein